MPDYADIMRLDTMAWNSNGPGDLREYARFYYELSVQYGNYKVEEAMDKFYKGGKW